MKQPTSNLKGESMKIRILVNVKVQEHGQPVRLAEPGEVVDVPISQAYLLIGLNRAEKIDEVAQDDPAVDQTTEQPTETNTPKKRGRKAKET